MLPAASPPIGSQAEAPLDGEMGECSGAERGGETGPEPQLRELGGRLAGKTLSWQVFTLAMWPFLELLLMSLVGLVDLGLAGRLGEDVVKPATDGLGAAGYVGWLIGMMLSAVGVGSTALIARAIGARRQRAANAALGQSMLLAAGWGVVLGVLVYLAAPVVAWWFGLSGRADEMAVTYLRILAVAVPMNAVLAVGGACLRGAGDTRTPFFVMLVVNAVNFIVSVMLAYPGSPWGGYGVAGIAWGTVAGWAVGAGVIAWVLESGRSEVSLKWRRLKPRRKLAWRIIRVGVPNLAESLGMWGGNALIAAVVGGLGISGALGSHIIAIRLEAVSFLPAVAVGTAAATLTGQYLGLGSVERAKRAGRLCWAWGAGIMTAMGGLFWFVPEHLARLVTTQPDQIEQVATLLRICAPVQFFFGSYLVLSQAIRGAGDTRTAMRITFASTFLVRLPAAYLLATPDALGLGYGIGLGWGLTGVWLGLCGELIVRGTLFIVAYLRGRWERVKI